MWRVGRKVANCCWRFGTSSVELCVPPILLITGIRQQSVELNRRETESMTLWSTYIATLSGFQRASSGVHAMTPGTIGGVDNGAYVNMYCIRSSVSRNEGTALRNEGRGD